MRLTPYAILVCAALWLTVSASASSLDQKKVHDAYNEGNFESVIATLEGFMKANKTYSRADSIFVAKHLAVVYSANPNSRERGRYYMNVLLELLPSAKLVDMYVSEEIDRIFDKVREEFTSRQQGFGIDSASLALPDRPKAAAPTQPAAVATEKKDHKLLWIAGGVGLVAVGAVAYFALADGQTEQAPDKIYAVPQ